MQPQGPPPGRPFPPAYQYQPQQQQQQGGPPGVRPGFQPGAPPPGGPAGGYVNGPSAAGPPGVGGPQALAGHMQQMKLGGPPGMAAQGPRPLGPPPAGPGPAQRPPAAAGMQQQPQQQPAGPANGYPQQHPQHQQQPVGGMLQRPPAMPGIAPGMRPPVQQQQQPPMPAAGGGMRPPPGVAGGMPRPGMPAGGLAPRPAMGGMPGPGTVPGGGMAPRPPAMGLGGMQQQQQPGAGSGGYSTPTKAAGALQQQQPHGTPPPFSLQMSTPSPTKLRGGMPGQPLMQHPQQQQQQGLRPPMPSLGGPPMPGFQQQQQQQPLQQHALPPGMGMPGMQPPMMQQQHLQQQQQQQQQQPPMGGMGMLPQQPGMGMAPPGMGGMGPPMPGMQMQPPRAPMPGMAPPMPMPGMQAQAPTSTKIDPSQIPRPMPYAIPTQVFDTRRENTHAIPPAADAPIVVRDKGSAGPRFLRSSLNMIPQSEDLLKGAALPMVAIISPLALQDPGDDPVQLVDWGATGPVRCQACKAYVNPYMRFVDGGRRMECNFCGAASDVPPEYQCPPGPDGERRDKYERPELCQGSVDMTVTAEYQARPPMRPTHFFLIEVSQPAIASGATAAACSSLAKLLDELPGGERTQVCVATFDSTVHFYSMRPGQAQPHMLVVPDVTDVYCPLAGNVLVNLSQSRQLVESLLESIPRMFANSQVQETCGGAALRSAVDALKGGEGGRLHAFLCSLPRRGALHLRLREVGRPPTDRDSLDSLLPENKEYAALAADAAHHQISIDLFLLTQAYVDVATLGVLCANTAGSLYHWSPWNPALDGDELFNDLRWALVRPQGLEAVGRLRCSRGLSVEKYIGSFYRRVESDLNFPALCCDHSVAAKLAYDEKLPERGEAYLQFALLYSTVSGERRVRVHTLALPITQSLGTTFRGADLDAYMAYVGRKVASQVPGHALGACKEAINKAAADALLAYRTHCASASASGQLILPEALKLLPLYTLALSKAPVFRADSRPDARAAAMWRLLSLPAHKAVPLLYARMLPLHNLLERPENAMPVPDKLWLSAEKLDPEGVFLLENGFEAFIYVGKAVPAETCAALFGVPSLDATDPQRPLLLPALDTPLSRRVRQLLDELRRQRSAYLRLRVLRRGDPLEAAFYNALVEDRSPASGMSYVEFLCFLHRQIQNKLS